MKITSCRARDAKRKGRVERPFRQLQETFLPEVELDGVPAGVAELNGRAERWLASRVHAVASRTTGEPPAVRLGIERPFLAPLPRVRFDTDYVETRRVHTAFPFVVIDNVRYSVPPRVLGQLVEIRRPVNAERFEIRWAGHTIATHTIKRSVRRGPQEVVWDAARRQAAEDEAAARTPRRHLHIVTEPAAEPVQHRLDLSGDLDVEALDLAVRYGFGALDQEPSA